MLLSSAAFAVNKEIEYVDHGGDAKTLRIIQQQREQRKTYMDNLAAKNAAKAKREKFVNDVLEEAAKIGGPGPLDFDKSGGGRVKFDTPNR